LIVLRGVRLLPIYQIVPPSILLHSAYAGLRVLLPLFVLSLHASPFLVGVIVSLLGLFPVPFAIRAGRMIDLIGVRKPMLIGSFTVIIGFVLAFTVPRLETMFLVAPIIGSAYILYQIAVNHASSVIGATEDRMKNFGIMALAFSTSGFVGPLVTGFAIDGLGYRAAFLVLGGSAAVAFLWLAVRSPMVPRSGAHAAQGKPRSAFDLLRNVNLRRAFAMGSALSMAWDVFMFSVPILGTQIGLSASEIGLILGGFGAGIFLARLLFPWVAHRLDEWRLLLTAMLATALLFFLFPLVHTLPILMTFAFVLGMGLGGTQPMVMTLIYAHAPKGRGGEAAGLRLMFVTISQAVMPLIFGLMGGAVGMTPVLWTMAVLMAGSGYALRAPKKISASPGAGNP
jgi:predicted MFS family arabinose efflux permease